MIKHISLGTFLVTSLILSGCGSTLEPAPIIDDSGELNQVEFDRQAKQLIDNLDKEEIERLKGVGANAVDAN